MKPQKYNRKSSRSARWWCSRQKCTFKADDYGELMKHYDEHNKREASQCQEVRKEIHHKHTWYNDKGTCVCSGCKSFHTICHFEGLKKASYKLGTHLPEFDNLVQTFHNNILSKEPKEK